MPFELARFGLPNIAAIVALALVPLVALPMHRHTASTAKAYTAKVDQVVQAAEQEIPANVAYAIFD
jgi:hypothetical protein